MDHGEMNASIHYRTTEMPVNAPVLERAYVVFVLAALFFLKKSVSSSQKLGKALPTPGGLPWLGPVWAVNAASIYKTFTQWSDRYGPLYEVTLFGQNIIVISDPQVANEILAQKGKLVSDRPPIGLIEHSKSGKYLPFLGNTSQLARQRKFGVLMNTYTTRQNYHRRFLPETVRFLHQLLLGQHEPFFLLEELCRRLSCRMAFGTTAASAAITSSAHHLMKNLSPGGRITNTLTFLRFVPTWMHPEKRDEAVRIAVEERVWRGAFYTAKAAHERGTLRDSYAKLYFDQAEMIGMSENEAINGIGMMATVTILTITAPLQKWLIAMSEHPDWQKTVQKELDDMLGDRLADIGDSPLLPHLRATIVESARWVSPVPTGIPHRLEADMEYNGYHLSKNSDVLACDWAMSRSEARYKDADTFNPARYLDPTSNNYREPLTEFPKLQGSTTFGWGRRACIGQDYVAAQLLVVCAAIMSMFSVSHGTDARTGQKVKIDIENATPHVIPIMDSVDLRFTPRSPAHGQKIRDHFARWKADDEGCDEGEYY